MTDRGGDNMEVVFSLAMIVIGYTLTEFVYEKWNDRRK